MPCWNGIYRNNGIVNAYCHIDADGALRCARESEARWMTNAPKGLVDGIPVGVKDNILVAGMPARFGSRLTSAQPAAHDAPAVPGFARTAPSSLARLQCQSSGGSRSLTAR